MEQQKSYMERLLSLRIEICQLAKRVLNCHPEDSEFYENVAQLYTKHLNSMQVNDPTDFRLSEHCNVIDKK